jgi:hypothetical protein
MSGPPSGHHGQFGHLNQDELADMIRLLQEQQRATRPPQPQVSQHQPRRLHLANPKEEVTPPKGQDEADQHTQPLLPSPNVYNYQQQQGTNMSHYRIFLQAGFPSVTLANGMQGAQVPFDLFIATDSLSDPSDPSKPTAKVKNTEKNKKVKDPMIQIKASVRSAYPEQSNHIV